MQKSFLKLLLVLSIASSHAYASDKQEQTQLMGYSKYLYLTRPVASLALYSFLQYQLGLVPLKIMGGIVAVGMAKTYLFGRSHPKYEKTQGQLDDLSNFKERFGRGKPVMCKGSSMGAVWSGNHASLKVQFIDESYEQFEGDSQRACRLYFFESFPSMKGIAVSDKANGSSFEFAISKSEADTIQHWLIEYDRKKILWTVQTGNCIDFIFEAFKALGYQKNLLPWLARHDLGMTSTKLSMLKYIMTEEFPEKGNVTELAAFGFNPCAFVVSTIADFILNPIYSLSLLSLMAAGLQGDTASKVTDSPGSKLLP